MQSMTGDIFILRQIQENYQSFQTDKLAIKKRRYNYEIIVIQGKNISLNVSVFNKITTKYSLNSLKILEERDGKPNRDYNVRKLQLN